MYFFVNVLTLFALTTEAGKLFHISANNYDESSA